MEIRNFDNIILFQWNDHSEGTIGVLVGLINGKLYRTWINENEVDNFKKNPTSILLHPPSDLFFASFENTVMRKLTDDEKRTLPLWLKEELMLQILKE